MIVLNVWRNIFLASVEIILGCGYVCTKVFNFDLKRGKPMIFVKMILEKLKWPGIHVVHNKWLKRQKTWDWRWDGSNKQNFQGRGLPMSIISNQANSTGPNVIGLYLLKHRRKTIFCGLHHVLVERQFQTPVSGKILAFTTTACYRSILRQRLGGYEWFDIFSSQFTGAVFFFVASCFLQNMIQLWHKYVSPDNFSILHFFPAITTTLILSLNLTSILVFKVPASENKR